MGGTRGPARVPKILGADVELGNFIEGFDFSGGTGRIASRLLLREIDGVPAGGGGSGHGSVDFPSGLGTCGENAQDWGRRFLATNGSCAYIDLDHLELALPETFSAFDFVAYWRASLDVARTAVATVNRELGPERRVHALANCSDGLGHSYGAHTNVLMTRVAFDNIISRKPHYLAFLAAFQTSSIVFTGAGKVGSENDRPPVNFQLAQRADYFERIVAESTTSERPLVNARAEALCGRVATRDDDEPELARLHVIFFDATLCQIATLLRVGALQIVTAMIEAEVVDSHLALDDPLEALQTWSHDPTLVTRARLVDGTELTAVDLQQRFLDQARAFRTTHGFDGIVPRADDILDRWEDTLQKLRQHDWPVVARRLDWALKRQLLEETIAAHSALSWNSPEIRHLDQLYASVDPDEGLFWPCERAGLVDCVVTPEAVRHAVAEPPTDTRAWTRTQLLRLAGARRIDDVDWDRVVVRLDASRHGYGWYKRRVVHLSRPYRGGRIDHEPVFTGDLALEEVVTLLDPRSDDPLVSLLPAKYTVS